MDKNRLYRLVFENMLEGFALCEMQYDADDKPIGFSYLEVNPAFEKLTGLKNVVGKPVGKVIPHIKETNPEIFEIYSKVVKTGKPVKYEIEITQLSIWLSISVFRPEKGYFAAIFENVTDRKKNEEKMAQHIAELELVNRLTVNREIQMIKLKNRVSDLEKQFKNAAR